MNKSLGCAFIVWISLFAVIWGDKQYLFNRRGTGRDKRLINGLPLGSHEIYGTRYMVQIKHIFGCTSLAPQYEHNFAECTSLHNCAGSLIHPEFVMTACHCMTYKLFYSGEYTRDLPKTPVVGEWADPWDLHSEYKSPFYPFHRDEENCRKMTYLKTYHPLFNTMGIYAGSPLVSKQPQVRHGSAFFPHQLCMQRTENIQNRRTTSVSWDIGVIKACQPFNIYKFAEVSLAPIHPVINLIPWTNEALAKSAVCLYAGWGKMLADGASVDQATGPEHLTSPTVLQHTWRYVECSTSCGRTGECFICSNNLGVNISYPTVGDSGGPVQCDGHVIALQSSGHVELMQNISSTVDFAIACAANAIDRNNLEELKLLKDKIFHWIDGQPIPNKTKTFRAYLNSQTSPTLSPSLSCSIIILEMWGFMSLVRSIFSKVC